MFRHETKSLVNVICIFCGVGKTPKPGIEAQSWEQTSAPLPALQLWELAALKVKMRQRG